ncbi:hypothetical protein HBB16_05595 [Pseudonocardia sp. MCCB 268]|nr:hypothetical protein [Pseudonocardia cytotoxica]
MFAVAGQVGTVTGPLVRTALRLRRPYRLPGRGPRVRADRGYSALAWLPWRAAEQAKTGRSTSRLGRNAGAAAGSWSSRRATPAGCSLQPALPGAAHSHKNASTGPRRSGFPVRADVGAGHHAAATGDGLVATDRCRAFGGAGVRPDGGVVRGRRGRRLLPALPGVVGAGPEAVAMVVPTDLRRDLAVPVAQDPGAAAGRRATAGAHALPGCSPRSAI